MAYSDMGSVSYDFSGETVVVTGATSGIGREIALRFGDAGATVLNADVEVKPKDVGGEKPTHEAIIDAGGKAAFVETDVSSPDQLTAVVERAREYGGVDVMVNNAGWFLKSSLEDVSEEEFERIHDINSKGVFFGVQAASREMRDRSDGGVIVNTASISSTHAQRNQIPYDSTKGSIRMITRGAALELADDGVRVNAVAPGHIATEFGAGAAKKERTVANDDLVKPVPLGRAGRSSDVAGAVLFLASEDASYITGELVYVDGGWQTF